LGALSDILEVTVEGLEYESEIEKEIKEAAHGE